MKLSLDVYGHDDSATLAVAGEVDRCCAGRLMERSLGAVHEHGPWLTIDLAGVTFMDCGGVEALLTIRCQSHLMGGQLWVISPSAPARRVFGTTYRPVCSRSVSSRMPTTGWGNC